MKIKTIMTTMLIAAATTGANAQAQKTGIFLENLDQSVKPCDDFYEYMPAEDGQGRTLCLLLIRATVLSTACRRTTTNE